MYATLFTHLFFAFQKNMIYVYLFIYYFVRFGVPYTNGSSCRADGTVVKYV